MADASIVHIGENSPEQVAYKLLELVAKVEGKRMHPIHSDTMLNAGETAADRGWILDTYAECLAAVSGKRTEVGKGASVFATLEKANWNRARQSVDALADGDRGRAGAPAPAGSPPE